MHCSANTDMDCKNTALFFGLSGTGKTTLSTDPKRQNFGFDLEKGVTEDTLNPEIAHYYLEIRPNE